MKLAIYIFSISLSLLVPLHANAWVINSDFESGIIGKKADGPSGFSGARGLTVYSNERSHSGKQSAKATITEGDVGWLQWGGTFDYPDLHEGDEIWFQAYIYWPTDWVWTDGPKSLRIHIADSGGANRGYYDIFLKPWEIHIGSEVGNPEFSTNVYPRNHIAGKRDGDVGRWVPLEMYVKFSAKPGQGIYRVWKDGKLIFEDKLTRTLISSTDKSDFIYLFTIWNNGAPATQSNYIDDITITNEKPSNTDAHGNAYIGTGDVTFKTIAKPNPPSSIK